MNIQKVRDGVWGGVKHHVVQYVLLAIFVFGSLTALGVMNYLPTPVVDLSVGQVSPRDVEAPRTLEYVNEQATEEARHQAMMQVAPVFTADSRVEHDANDDLTRTFAVARQIIRAKLPPGDPRRDDLESRSPIKLDGPAAALLTVSPETLDGLETHARATVHELLQKGVKADDLPAARKQLETNLARLALPPGLLAAETAVTLQTLKPNMAFNWAETARLQQEKSQEVPPVKVTVQRGTMIIRRGDVVTPEQAEILKAFGSAQSHFSGPTIAGVGLLIVISIAAMLIYLGQYEPALLSQTRLMWLAALLLVSTAYLCHWLQQTNGYLAPVALCSMLIAILIDYRLALMATLVLSCLAGLFTNAFEVVAASLLTGALAVLSVAHVNRRTDLIFASLVTLLVNVLSVLAMELVKNPDLQQLGINTMYGALNGVIASLAVMGALPFLENLFGVTTHIKLLELANPGEPLLQKLMVEAPGTYHHSIIVANLADAAARAIGADALLARVGAYYHDIGKMKRSTFFVENQLGRENPHERLTPSLSTMIIHSHVSEGIEMAKQYRLPEPVRDFIDMHHGTRLVAYFYHQAKEKVGGDVTEETFRYHGRKPHTKETAIVMVADSVEAKARLLREIDRDGVQKMVNETLRTIMGDGQLDDSDLSLRDIRLIGESFTNTIMSIYHNRVEYPKEVLETLAGSNKSNAAAVIPSETPSEGKPDSEPVPPSDPAASTV